jgi:site-specific DNA recombinase
VPEQAEVVRRIFAMSADGHGVKAIAKALNADGVPSPRPQQGRSQSWAPSSVREALFRRTYRGEIVWNRTKKRDQWGQQRQQERPSDDWITVPAPHLRIVEDDLWNRAHARMDAARATYLVSANGQKWGRPPTGLVSKYLLTGLTRCATCGGSMASHTRSHGSSRGRWRVPVYVCSSYANRGPSVCRNGMPLPMAAADREVLEKFREVVLDPEIVAGAIEDAIQALRPADDDALADRRRGVALELQQVEAQLASYAQAIATVGAIPAVTAALKEREAQRLRLSEQLAALDAARTQARQPFSAARLRKDLRRRMDDWRSLLCRQTPQARQILTKLIDGRLVFTAHPDEQLYRFRHRDARALAGRFGRCRKRWRTG